MSLDEHPPASKKPLLDNSGEGKLGESGSQSQMNSSPWSLIRDTSLNVLKEQGGEIGQGHPTSSEQGKLPSVLGG